MLRATTSRKAVAFLAASLLVPWAASAASPPGARPALELLAPLRLLARLWVAVSPWAKEGMMIDPSGQSVTPPPEEPASTSGETETGMHIDPSGQPGS